MPVPAQVWQTPQVVAVEQHVPSTHWPFAQSPATEHPAPIGRPVHVIAVRLHRCPFEHWPSAVHCARQSSLVALHVNGAQGVVGPGTQVPLPLQLPTAVFELPEQTVAPQGVLDPTFAQTPPIVQLPVSLRHGLELPVWLHIPSAPEVTGLHVPLGLPHAWQAPLHAVLQQRPSTQLLDVQSVPVPQTAPSGSF